MAELYDKEACTINERLINIYKEGELVQNATIRKFQMVGIKHQYVASGFEVSSDLRF